MDLPEEIAGLDPRRVRAMFKAFLETDRDFQMINGVPMFIPRRLTTKFVSDSLGITETEAAQICASLVKEGWLEEERLHPTHRGMALAHHIDRPRISRSKAKGIVSRVLDWARRVNLRRNRRVLVREIDLYGSLERGQSTVGDIDLIVKFTTMDLGLDVLPEDMEREEELLGELQAISEYLSPASDIDQALMPAANYRTIFPLPRKKKPVRSGAKAKARKRRRAHRPAGKSTGG